MTPERPQFKQAFSGAHPSRCAPRHKARSGARGFTLIEVMVSLTIFVIGAIAVIRIFPPALNAVQGSGDRSVASRLNSSELSAFAADSRLVPDAIYDGLTDPTNPALTGIYNTAYEGAFVGSRIVNTSLPDGIQAQAIANSALGHLRFIRGEKHEVMYRDKAGSTTEQFLLTRYPYSGNVTIAQEGVITGVRLSRAGELNFSNARTSDGNPCFDPAAPKRPLDTMRSNSGYTYYVDYRWRESLDGANSRVQGVQNEAVRIPPDSDAVFGSVTIPIPAPPLPDPNKGATVLQAKRTAATLFDQAVTVRYRRNIASVPSIAQEAGIGYVPLTTLGLRNGETVSADYTVASWNLLLEDAQPSLNVVDTVAVPPTTDALMQLSVKNLDEDAPTTLDSLYMVPDVNDPNHFIYSALDNYKFGVTAPAKQPSTTAPGELINLQPNATTRTQGSLRTGSIVFNATRPAGDMGAPQARVSYLTLDQWHHQLSVAAKDYTAFYSDVTGGANDSNFAPAEPFNPRERWREYFAVTGTGFDGYLYLRPSEAGKTLLVTYEYQPTAGNFVVVNDAVVTVEDEVIDKPDNVPAAIASIPSTAHAKGLVSRAAIQVNNQALPIKPTAILSVKGASVQSRTAWAGGTQFQQTVLSAYRPQESQ